MNKPYTCHNCGTVHDLLPDPDLLPAWAALQYSKVEVKCPGCYDGGFSLEESIYTINLETMQRV